MTCNHYHYMLEVGQRGLFSVTFSTDQLRSLKDPFGIVILLGGKQGWGQKPAFSSAQGGLESSLPVATSPYPQV